MQNATTDPSTSENTAKKIQMYVTTWCGDCRMAKRWFDSHGIPYEYINIEEDDKAAEYVRRLNGGYQSVPTIIFPDGSILVEPSPRQLAAKFQDDDPGNKRNDIVFFK
ncbi:MAG TPA: mycoredoxin [Ktedonobacteraceae bacterium]|nr:mycoredoxin [Ktedonobacteraceae bacterium]